MASTMAQTSVIRPKMMKSHCIQESAVAVQHNMQSMWTLTRQDSRAPPIWAIPYANRPPNEVAMAFPRNQIPCRKGCSSRLYHIPVMREKPGEMEASATPRKKRATRRPGKVWTAAWQQRMMAQARLRYVSGRISQDWGVLTLIQRGTCREAGGPSARTLGS